MQGEQFNKYLESNGIMHEIFFFINPGRTTDEVYGKQWNKCKENNGLFVERTVD